MTIEADNDIDMSAVSQKQTIFGPRPLYTAHIYTFFLFVDNKIGVLWWTNYNIQ